jgi:hypothetical protein
MIMEHNWEKVGLGKFDPAKGGTNSKISKF